MVLNRVLCFSSGGADLLLGDRFLGWHWYDLILHNGSLGGYCANSAQDVQKEEWRHLIKYFRDVKSQ